MEERITIALDPEEVIARLRVGLDERESEAQEYLKEIVRPRVEAERNRNRCRPAFELETLKREAVLAR